MERCPAREVGSVETSRSDWSDVDGDGSEEDSPGGGVGPVVEVGQCPSDVRGRSASVVNSPMSGVDEKGPEVDCSDATNEVRGGGYIDAVDKGSRPGDETVECVEIKAEGEGVVVESIRGLLWPSGGIDREGA